MTSWFLLNERGQCSLNGPPFVNTISQSTVIDLKMVGPFSHCSGLSFVRETVIGPRVVRLFDFCCPSNIYLPALLLALYTLPTRIVFVVVPTIKRMLGTCSFSDNGKKEREIPESLTDTDTPSPIISKLTSSGICTSLNHSRPRPIFRSSRSLMSFSCLTMCPSGLEDFLIPAPTRLSVARTQIVTRRNDKISARASTVPRCTFPFVGSLFDDGQPIKRKGMSEINKRTVTFCHNTPPRWCPRNSMRGSLLGQVFGSYPSRSISITN